jgi:hypothetical protein
MLFVLAATMRQYFCTGKTMTVSSAQRIKFNNWCDFLLTKNVQTNDTVDINSDIIKGVKIVYLPIWIHATYDCNYELHEVNLIPEFIWVEIYNYVIGHLWVLEASWNVMAHMQKPDFIFRRNGRVHVNWWGASVQLTAVSRGVRISGSNAGHTMFQGSVKGTGYPLRLPVSPSLPLPCITVCHHISTGVSHDD